MGNSTDLLLVTAILIAYLIERERSGLNIINVLHTAFTNVDLKYAKKESQVSSVIWRFWDLRA
jgi:hypothetical protein